MTFPTLTVETFHRRRFRQTTADGLGLPESSVVINSVRAGSVVVDFHIQPEGVQLEFSADDTAEVATRLADPTMLEEVFGEVVVETVQTPQQAIAAATPPPSPPPPPSPSPPLAVPGGDDGADVAMIAGIAGGAGAIVLCAGGFLFYKKRKQAVSQGGGDALALQQQGSAA
jgi:hypothetical protein